MSENKSIFYDHWTDAELTQSQKDKYNIVPVGESSYSGRTTFQVQCKDCGKILHHQTNNPTWYIKIHEETCK